VPTPSATETAVELVTRFENNFNTYDVGALWTRRWPLAEGGEGTARGVDIFRVRDGKIAEKPTYVTM
jgi:ketosteroid isomerase-like protein